MRLKVWTELFYESDTEKSWDGSCTLKTKTYNQVVYVALVWDQADYNSVLIGKWKKEKCRDLVCRERMKQKASSFYTPTDLSLTWIPGVLVKPGVGAEPGSPSVFFLKNAGLA